MAVIAVQHSAVAGGLSPTWSAAAPAGDSFGPNTAAQTLLARNQGATPIIVTVPTVTACNEGVQHPQAFTVAAAGLAPMLLGTFAAQFYNDASGNVNWTYSTTVAPPPGVPTAALLPSAYGLGVGVYRYQVTIVNASGETTGNLELAITTTTGNQVVKLDGLPTGAAGTTQRKLYRTSVGGAAGSEKLLATIADNTTTTFTDSVPDSLLGAAIPTSNTAAVPAPGAAAVATAAGTTLGVGVYRYQITFTNAGGETNGGVEFTITTTTNNTNVSMTSIPLGPSGTTNRRIYRTAVGGAAGTEKLLTTIADNTTTTFTDNIADGSLGAAIPTTNVANVLQVAVTAP
jgi:hypothetical protein